MESEKLTKMLEAHQLWLKSGGKRGQRADLTDAKFQDATELQGADLREAILNGIDFKNAQLTRANFQGAELRRANFDGAILRGTNLREADLQNANVETANFLLTAHLAGANVAGAKLPKPIAEFEGLKTIAEATSNAQKLFVAMLSGCLYSCLTIGTTTDVALLTNSASSPLPIIGTAIPMVGFYLLAPIILFALYFYFHLNMQRIWEALAEMPAVFPDGRSLDKRADPWLLNGLVRAHFFRLRGERPALSRVQQWLSVVLAWWIVPATLFVFWGRFLMRHDVLGTELHVTLLAAAIGFGGWMSYRLARATLRQPKPEPFRWARVFKDLRTYKRIAGVVGTGLVGVLFYRLSLGAIDDIPSYHKDSNLASTSFRRMAPLWLGRIGFTTFANLKDRDVSIKPPNWTGGEAEYPLVKGARLVEAKMQGVNAEGAFLVNADLRGADLRNADFAEANLSNATLTNANLSNAGFGETNLSNATLSGANLSHAIVNFTNLSNAKLVNTNLSNAEIEVSNLSHADLRGANLSNADLQDADLSNAVLLATILYGVDLRSVEGLTQSQLEGAKCDSQTRLPEDLPP